MTGREDRLSTGNAGANPGWSMMAVAHGIVSGWRTYIVALADRIRDSGTRLIAAAADDYDRTDQRASRDISRATHQEW